MREELEDYKNLHTNDPAAQRRLVLVLEAIIKELENGDHRSDQILRKDNVGGIQGETSTVGDISSGNPTDWCYTCHTRYIPS